MIPPAPSGQAFELPVATNASRRSIQDFAEYAARELEYAPAAELEPIVQKLGGRLHPRWISLQQTAPGWQIPEAIPDSASDHHDGVVLVRGRKDFDIFLSPHTGMLRDRFTIAHELGHYFLHSRQGERPIAAARLESDQAEWEANWFAAAFLMPEQAVRKALERYGQDLYMGAATFLVSMKAFEVRLRSLALLH